MRKAMAAFILAGILTIACALEAGDISNATDAELDNACNILSLYLYDYRWLDGPPILSARTIEVAADINTVHPGPEETRKYCEGR